MKCHMMLNEAPGRNPINILANSSKVRMDIVTASRITIATFALCFASTGEARPFDVNGLTDANFRLESVGHSAVPSSDRRTAAAGDNSDFVSPRTTLDMLPSPAWSEPEHPAQYGPPDEQAPTAALSAEERHLAKIERFNGKLEVVFQLANALDAIETISCSHKAGCNEGNPLFGNKPSTAKVLGIKTAVAGLHYYIYKKRNHIEPKGIRFFEIVSTVVYAAVAGVNISRTF